MEMRDIRNRISHDYLETMLHDVYEAVKNKYILELLATKNTISNYLETINNHNST
ncbi:hypothetical protein ACFL4D_01230 [Candidatus Margulisiibacteriota bacterium]